MNYAKIETFSLSFHNRGSRLIIYKDGLITCKLFPKLLNPQKNAEFYFKQSEAITGKLPKNQKHFLLAKLFGLTPGEIERLDGTNQRDAGKNIKYVADRLRTGEALLLDPTEIEIKDAEKRLERFRAYQRQAAASRRVKVAA